MTALAALLARLRPVLGLSRRSSCLAAAMIRWLNRPLTSATTTAMPRAGHQVGVVFVAVDFVGFAPGVRDAHADAGQFPFQVPGQGQRGQRESLWL